MRTIVVEGGAWAARSFATGAIIDVGPEQGLHVALAVLHPDRRFVDLYVEEPLARS
jgi:hypothetical protein